MFCADWALGLAVWFGMSRLHPALAASGDPKMIVPAAAATGAAAMLALHPFDFVRGSMSSGMPSKGFVRTLPLSTVAFTTVAFGSYWTFSQRDSSVDGYKLSRFKWAGASALMGSLAELPLDAAKIEMAGGLGRAAALAVARAPLGAMMLFAVDAAIVGDGLR
jgi:hypothetical protein